jgi:YidC/Oxa1 family membrane protein insertase
MQMDNRNMILAIVLSVVVLFGWQFFIAGPQMEQAQRRAEIEAQQQAEANQNLATPNADGTTTPATAAGGQSFATRADALAVTPRVPVVTESLTGSINLQGGRIDDLSLNKYHETVDPTSPKITLFSPKGGPNGYYAEQGWVNVTGGSVAVPAADTIWSVEGANQSLTEATPVTLRWDNGDGVIFRRTFTVDKDYLFTVTQSVENASGEAVALYPYSRVTREYTPHTSNFFILQEGPYGVLGSENLVELSYQDLAKNVRKDVSSTGGWLGFTDKYWAAVVMPEPATPINARFSYAKPGTSDTYETSFVDTEAVSVAPGATVDDTSYLYAGAKVESIIHGYETAYKFDRLELLIDWGWFHFITKPMFLLIRALHGLLGNFGLAILAVTVIVKALFFPLANRSFASMAAMRRVQPEMKSIQERFKDDRPAQQQAMMELYKKEKINPLSGCWPILIQIPVFFSLYKVLFVTIEMRHAPFFGWIRDLAAPDPTNIFTLFGLIPWDPVALPVIGAFLHLGIWPILMGITMWVQMKLNPPPPDPTQAMIFAWMPVIFTFMLGSFPAGLVIYWAWNNLLSVTQQYFIMKRHGAEVNLLGNIMSSFKRKPKVATEKPAGGKAG